jgi:hypothetical protein
MVSAADPLDRNLGFLDRNDVMLEYNMLHETRRLDIKSSNHVLTVLIPLHVMKMPVAPEQRSSALQFN